MATISAAIRDLPKPAKILANHVLSLVAAEGRQVGKAVVDAVPGIGVRIGQNQSASKLQAVLITPSKGVGQARIVADLEAVGTQPSFCAQSDVVPAAAK